MPIISGNNTLDTTVDSTYEYPFFETYNSDPDDTSDGYPDYYPVENDAGHTGGHTGGHGGGMSGGGMSGGGTSGGGTSPEGGNIILEASIKSKTADITANTQLTEAEKDLRIAEADSYVAKTKGTIEIIQQEAKGVADTFATGENGVNAVLDSINQSLDTQEKAREGYMERANPT